MSAAILSTSAINSPFCIQMNSYRFSLTVLYVFVASATTKMKKTIVDIKTI